MVETSIVFFPAAPFLLFMHGKDSTISKGTEITAHVGGDLKLDQAKFQSGPPPSPGATNTAAGGSSAAEPTSSAQLEVSSTPDGADIEIDGSFVGSTPSTVGATAGQHQLVIKKTGFKPWEKALMVSNGHIKINATLEARVKITKGQPGAPEAVLNGPPRSFRPRQEYGLNISAGLRFHEFRMKRLEGAAQLN